MEEREPNQLKNFPHVMTLMASWPVWVKYLIIAASVAFALLLRYPFQSALQGRFAFITLFPAIVIGSWIAGWWGGCAATVASAAAVEFLYFPHSTILEARDSADTVSQVLFITVGLTIAALGQSQRSAWMRAEESVAEAKHAAEILRESESRKSAVLSVALDCIITADEHGKIVEFNPAAEETFGYKRSDVIGLMIADVIVPPSLRAAHNHGLEHYRKTGDGPILGKRVEVTGMRRDGSEFPVEIAIVPITTGGRTEFTAYLRDIGERKRQDAEREALLEQIQTSTKRQRRFLSDVLASVTGGHLILCESLEDLPVPLAKKEDPVTITENGGLSELRHLTLDATVNMPIERIHDLVTAVSEAGMNAVTHGGGSGTGVLSVGDDGTVQVRIEDHGLGISLETLPNATLQRGFSTKSSLGHGFKMMQYVDKVFVLTGPTGTIVVLQQALETKSVPWA